MPSVLIIEDMQVVREMLCEMLSAYDCHAVRTAEEALELLERLRFDAVITDVKLPGLGGAELLRRVGARWPDLPIIVITGGDPALRETDFLDLGASAYMQKPFTLDEIMRAVEEVLGK